MWPLMGKRTPTLFCSKGKFQYFQWVPNGYPTLWQRFSNALLMLCQCFKGLNRKALMYVFLWEVTHHNSVNKTKMLWLTYRSLHFHSIRKSCVQNLQQIMIMHSYSTCLQCMYCSEWKVYHCYSNYNLSSFWQLHTITVDVTLPW